MSKRKKSTGNKFNDRPCMNTDGSMGLTYRSPEKKFENIKAEVKFSYTPPEKYNDTPDDFEESSTLCTNVCCFNFAADNKINNCGALGWSDVSNCKYLKKYVRMQKQYNNLHNTFESYMIQHAKDLKEY